MDYTPDAALPISFEDGSYICSVCKVATVAIYLCALPILLRCVFRQRFPSELGYAVEGFGKGVVIIVYRYNLVATGFKELEGDVRAFEMLTHVSANGKVYRMEKNKEVIHQYNPHHQ